MANTPCRAKERYPTRKHALNSAGIFKRETGVKLFVYKCRDCHYYHLTGTLQ